MIFSESIKKAVYEKFEQNLPLGNQTEEIVKKIQSCGEDAQTILKLFYATMPSADIGDYDFLLYKKYADFALFLAKEPLWGDIPQDIFLNYVAYYRVNNEAIEDCRQYFYDALIKRVRGKTMKEAAKEVNLWCAEHVKYKMTDERTASPLTLLKTAYGRCGEESTFTVTAMRSLGIPARQVYTPKWAHCDDNHAWVEVWCGGEWYYLGACEPELQLNRGWFNNAAARAMLVHTRSFLPIEGEETVSLSGQTLLLNRLSRYALHKNFTVTVKDGLPLQNIQVRFEMLNYSEFSPLAAVKTNEYGKAELTLGLGSLLVSAEKNGKFVEALVNTDECDFLLLDFSQAVEKEEEGERDFDFFAPKDNPQSAIALTDEQKLLRGGMKKQAETKRKEYAKSFYDEEKAKKLAASFGSPKEVEDILRTAEGNFSEIYAYLSSGGDNELKLELLKSLNPKDLSDIKCGVLEEHFEQTLKYRNDFPKEIFIPYVLCPRIAYEEITAYRKFILETLSKSEAELFKLQPLKAWEYVNKYREDALRLNERLPGTPQGIITSGIAGANGRKLLFAAIMRTLGVPARVNSVDKALQYYKKDKFVNVENEAKKEYSSKLLLSCGSDKLFYYSNFTLAVLKNGAYQTLELEDISWKKGKTQLALESGFYRLITSLRTPSGNQYAKKYCFELKEGEKKHLAISLRHRDITDFVTDVPFPPFTLYDGFNQKVPSQSIKGKTIFVWLEENSEPTEHILNEFIEAKDIINKTDWTVAFIREENIPASPTLEKAQKALTSAKLYYSDFSQTAELMARRVYLDPDTLPIVVAAEGGRSVYACGGYNVGAVNLIVQIFNLSN